MFDDYAGPSARGRFVALLLIVALHAVGVVYWPQRLPAAAGTSPARATTIAFVSIAPATRVPAGPAAPSAVVPQRVRKRPAPPPPAMRLIAPQPAAPEAQASAPVQKSAADIVVQARRDVGKIDRDLRAASLDMAQRTLVFSPSKRERLLGGAHAERGPPQVVEQVMNDGRRVSRIGGMCFYKESNGLVGARDVFRDGVRTVWKGC